MAEELERLIAACHILFDQGHEHFHMGHVSLREAPQSDRFWVKPTGLGLGEVGLDDLVLLDLNGRRIRGAAPIHQEMPIHAEIYRRRPDVGAVVHTHPLGATALAATTEPFRVVSQDSLPFAAGFGRYDSAGLVVTRDEGRAVAEALADHSLVLLRNHGIAVADTTLEGAVYLAVAFERSVRLQQLASTLGPIREIAPDEITAMTTEFAVNFPDRARTIFDYLRRQLADRAQ